jgi:hypothetical protein
MNGRENIYWLFSSAAQAVAAFVAFLLAGYALVHAMMETAAQADETLIEIHEALKQRYHRQLSLLVVTTALAILACLSAVYFNKGTWVWFPWLAGTASALSAAAVVGGVVFVVTIVDPGKYRKAARQLARETKPKPDVPAAASRAEFFANFIAVERLLRILWERRTGGERLSRRPGPPTFREMLETLMLTEALPSGLSERLLAINRYRNLVFHGHVEQVDGELLGELKAIRAQLEEIVAAGRELDAVDKARPG